MSEDLRVSPYPIPELAKFMRHFRKHFYRAESLRTLERFVTEARPIAGRAWFSPTGLNPTRASGPFGKVGGFLTTELLRWRVHTGLVDTTVPPGRQRFREQSTVWATGPPVSP